MSTFKAQYSRALRIYKSDSSDIPYPNVSEVGTSTSVVTSKLVDSAGLFITNNIKTGDVVYNDTLLTSATVLSVDSETQITLNANIFTAVSQLYTIYAMSPQTGIGNPGCVLHIGGAGIVSVVTIGGDNVLFTVAANTILPVQIIRLKSTGTTATLVNALW